ncbi:MAG: Ig-like domain-containing protein, partial [bacterium]
FKFDKTTNQLTEVGPLFDSSSPYSWNSAEGWYFSYSMPTKLYMQDGSKLLRYDVLAHTFETVFDSTTQYPNTVIRQTNSSNNDDVHSATLEDASSYAALGCMVYKESTRQFFFYPSPGDFDECQIDKSGRYLVIKEKIQTSSQYDVDNVIVDINTGIQTTFLDQNGAGGHSDLGYGWYLSADNWNANANAWRLWDLSDPLTAGISLNIGNLLQGGLVYHDLDWNVFDPSHISFENANASTPLSQQYACGGAANTIIAPHANEIVCFMLDSSVALHAEQALVVAPVMTDLNASGGNATCPGCEDYAKDPKGNIDPTGQYFFWVSNLGGSRMDAFMVKIPSQVLTGTSSGGGTSTPPTVSITNPTAGTSVSGTVTLAADASDNTGISKVQFQMDGTNLGSAATQAPYAVSWDTTTASAGTHTLTAIATDSSGNTAQSSVGITVANDSASSGGNTSTPTASISSPSDGSVVDGSVTVSANIAGDSSIASVQFRLDDTNLGTPVTQMPYSVTWNTSTLSPGKHVLTVVATDSTGNTITSSPVTVTTAGDVAPPTSSSGTPGDSSTTGPQSSGGGGFGVTGMLI